MAANMSEKTRSFFNSIRSPKKIPLKKAVVNTVIITILGFVSGIAIKYFDIYTNILGEIFSELSVWVVICTVIAVYSVNPKRASVNVFLYCVMMLAGYYLTAELTNSYYSMSFVYGWTVFSLLTPVFAFFAWYGKGKGVFAVAVKVGIIVFMLSSAFLLFGIHIWDILLTAVVFAITSINSNTSK